MNNITEYSDIFDDEEQQYNMDEEEKHNEQDGRANNLNSWKHFIF